MTLEERKEQRSFKNTMRYAVYDGREHDLYLAIPEYEKLQRCFKLVFDKEGIDPPLLLLGRNKYLLSPPGLLSATAEHSILPMTQDAGYWCIQGKFKGSKGLHKIKLHRLAYRAFYEMPDPTMHIHHIDKNKRNNRADNLVALTEEEHCEVHKRDVRLPRNLFTAVSPKGLLVPKDDPPSFKSPTAEVLLAVAQDRKRAVKQLDDPLLKEVEEGLQEPKVLVLLNAEPTPENVNVLIETVDKLRMQEQPSTVLEYLCALVRR